MTSRPVVAPSPWNIANALTVLRMLLVPLFGWLLLAHDGASVQFRYLAALTFAAAMVTDRVDGELARSRGLITKFGQIADPIADKAMMTMAFVGLSMIEMLWWWVTAIMLVREWGITVLRFVVIRHGVMPAGRGGKVKTAVQTSAVVLLCLPLWTWPASGLWLWLAYALLAVAVLITVITGYEITRDALRLRQTSPRALRRQAARERRRRGSGVESGSESGSGPASGVREPGGIEP